MSRALPRPLPSVGLAACLLALGCTGSADTGARGSETGGRTDATDPLAAKPVSCQHSPSRRVRRLSAREYLNVLTDLLGEGAAALAKPLLPFEPRLGGFDNQDAGLLVASTFQEALFSIAESLAANADPSTLWPCAPTADTAVCLSGFAQGFARRAYGRPATAEELSRLLAAAATGQDYAASVRQVIEVVLQSPNTLYATELGPPDSGPTAQPVLLTPHEVASQLSLVLSASRPDESLLQAADSGQLATPEALRSELGRLLATPRARAQLRHFIGGWLDLAPVADAPKDAGKFPEYTPELGLAMQQEVDDFIDQKIAGGAGTLLSLLTEPSTSIPAALGPIYGQDLLTTGLDPLRRKGILSLPGLLTYHSADQHSGPIERGLFVKRQLFCQELPPPPASVLERIAQRPVDAQDVARTTRMKYETHVNEPFCAGCHEQFDGIGFGLEELDALGRYRTTENGLPVDSTGEIAGTDVDGPFSGVVQLSDKLAQSEQIKACFVEHFFRFATSRPPLASEQCVVDGWAQRFGQAGGRIQDLISQWLLEPRFAERSEDR